MNYSAYDQVTLIGIAERSGLDSDQFTAIIEDPLLKEFYYKKHEVFILQIKFEKADVVGSSDKKWTRFGKVSNKFYVKQKGATILEFARKAKKMSVPNSSSTYSIGEKDFQIDKDSIPLILDIGNEKHIIVFNKSNFLTKAINASHVTAYFKIVNDQIDQSSYFDETTLNLSSPGLFLRKILENHIAPSLAAYLEENMKIDNFTYNSAARDEAAVMTRDFYVQNIDLVENNDELFPIKDYMNIYHAKYLK